MKIIKLMKNFIAFVLLVTLLAGTMCENVMATSLPYDTYNYNYREDVVFTPAAYVPDDSVSGVELGCGAFFNPQDLCIAENGDVYVADTGNNRIVVLNNSMTEVLREIATFTHDGIEDSFQAPYGVCVSENNQLYVADSQNKRVVILTPEGEYVGVVENPQSEMLEDGFIFTPLKVSVDYADRVYCVAQNVFEGIMVFEDNGNFSSYFGTINVKISLWQKFWRKLATKEERAKQQLFIPTEFTGIDVDADGFVYASNIDNEGKQAVRRLNPKGQDVIKKGQNKNVGGDVLTYGGSDYSGPSTIVDVVYRSDGIYSLLDSKRGRIFTYDSEGNLLYIFGGLGTQAGTFASPVAIEAVGDKVLVLDAYRAEILTFNETAYGNLINEAVALRYDGDEKLAVDLWKQVLKLDENNELANTGIGKAYLSSGNYKEAMKYLKLGMNRQYYSVAYKRYRNEILADNLSYLLTALILGIAGYNIGIRIYRKKKNIKAKEDLLNG